MNAGDPEGDTAGSGAVFDADDEIGPDLARVDWAATPLGPPDGWPQSLRAAVTMVLASRFSMWMAWGPELTFFCNAAYRRDTLRAKYPWALGRPVRDVWAEIWDDVSPRLRQVLSTGRATWDEALPLRLERSGYPEETYHTFSYSPLRDDAGRVAGVLCVVREDTERVIAERRLATLRDLGTDPRPVRTDEQALTFAAQQLARNRRDLPFALIYLREADGSARLAGVAGIAESHPAAPDVLSADHAAVWPLAELARGEPMALNPDKAAFRRLPAGDWPDPPTRALALPLPRHGGAPYGFLIVGLNRYRRLDAGYRQFLELVAGHLSAAIAAARSYRAEQRRAEELAELDRVKTDFFANISHEFRTPLTLILGPVADLRDRITDLDEPARRELDGVHRNALRLAKLVNTLLDFSRIEAGRMEARYAPVDLSSVTVELVAVFRSAADRAGLTLTADCAALGEPVYLDRDMWEKVMLNLLSNALKFTFDGSITVRVRRDDADAVITVADTGIGVPAAEMPRLFERFHRAENVAARSAEGSGIGLALTKELVMLHGGSIGAESTVGVGTTFTIRLPFGTAHLPADAVAPAESRPPAAEVSDAYLQEALRWLPEDRATRDRSGGEPTGAGETAVFTAPPEVLVADDNADMREYLSRLLRSAGYRVRAINDGLQALASIHADVPDLVISDVMMPGLDGLELVARLRTDTRTAGLPVLLLSARAGPEASVEGLDSGADDYLIKPFESADLLARVRTNIELARLRTHYANWRAALVDSLQEALFICDEDGAVIEINAMFTDILGYGPEGLPYHPHYPWWPDPQAEPEADQQCVEAFATMMHRERGSFTIPLRHRDGRQVWITANFSHADDPETGRRALVGTFRDVTAEHDVAQRQQAMAALNQLLAQADTVDDALRATTAELRRLWQARRVLALTFRADNAAADSPEPPELIVAGDPTAWPTLPMRVRQVVGSLCEGELLGVETGEPGTAGIGLQHPDGTAVIWIELADERPFTPEEQTLLAALAGRLSHGLHRVRLVDQQRETALALQRAILGPAEPAAGIVARYQPAGRPLQVGGDWYDVVDLGGDRIALVVGDCVGHGLASAAVMGQLRSACRALLLEDPSPAVVLSSLDRFAARLPGAECTTVFCAVLTPQTGELVYSTAGHPPPILVSADRGVRLLDEVRSVPIGLRPGRDRGQAGVVIPGRATILLYTDGLVERRREPLDAGIERVTDLVQRGRSMMLDELADSIMTGLAPDHGYQDDVALLLYRQPAPLDIRFAAELNQLAPSRAALRGWLNRAELGSDRAQDVLVAAGEAVANAIEHGHRHRPGTISLHAVAAVDLVHVTVTDSGSWKTPEPGRTPGRGRGIALMRALVNDVSIQPGSTGTTVELRAGIG